MIRRLHIADNLTLPLDFVTERIAFLARTGAGKSGGMRVLFEEFLKAKQFVIFVDPKGDAYGVRAAGTGPGYPVLVMGGDHGDVPLEATGGKVVAEFLVSERVSSVLDISDFGKASMVRFVTDLARTLYKLNRDVVHVFLDEADMIAGEKFYDPHCLEAVQLIQNKGRHRGFGVTTASQRSAMLNKSVLYASGTLVAMQTTSPKDIATVCDWFEVVATDPKAAKEIVRVLPTLKTRDALVYSPQYLGSEPQQITFKSFQTFDSMRTPRPGETRQQPKSLADIDLSAVRRDMAETIEKAKAEDPKELQKKVAELQRDLKHERETREALPSEIKTKTEIKTVEKRIVIEGTITRLEKLLEDSNVPLERLELLAERMHQERGHILTAIDEAKGLNAQNMVAMPVLQANPRTGGGILSPGMLERTKQAMMTRPSPVSVRINRLRETTGARSAASSEGITLTGPERRILDALAWWSTIGIQTPDKGQVGFIAGYRVGKSVGGTFGNILGQLRSRGLIEYPAPGTAQLTAVGRTLATAPADTPSLDALHQAVFSKLDAPQNRVLQAVVNAYPDKLTKQRAGELAGYNVGPSVGGTFGNILGRLRSLALVDYPLPGYVVATDLLFPPGLI